MVRGVELTDAERTAEDEATRRNSAAATEALVSEPQLPPFDSQGRVMPTTLTPSMVMQLQRSVGNAEASRLLARQRASTPPVTPTAPTSTRILQRKIGRTDGVSDMDADQTKVWLEHAGLWTSLEPADLDLIEAMMQSGDQWEYTGMGAVHLLKDVKKVRAAGVSPATVLTIRDVVPFNRGLIHGHLLRESNQADLHVDAGDGSTLAADMLTVAQDVYGKMTLTSTLPGRADGKVYLRPQGAAIIKIVSQLLGEALGDPRQIELAREHIKWRKIQEKAVDLVTFGLYKPKKSGEVLDKSVVPEHTEYIKSLVGLSGVDIKPLLKNTLTLEEFSQNMLEASKEGQDRLVKYLQSVQQGTAISMDIYIDRAQLPDVINFMRSGRRTQ
jgi:hypothetical protein